MTKTRLVAALGAVLFSATIAWATQQYDAYDDATSIGSAVSQYVNSAGQAVPNGPGTPYHLIALASTNCHLVAAGAHTVFAAELGGVGSAPAYLKFFDKATAPVAGTDTPIKTLIIPAASTAANGGGSNVALALGFAVTNGLGFCVTDGIADADTSAVPASSFIINFDWK